MTTDRIDKATLQRYIQSREKIDKDIDFIMVFTAILSQYKECAGDTFLVDLYSIGYVNQMMHGKILDIIEELDLFLSLGDAMGAVMEVVTKES